MNKIVLVFFGAVCALAFTSVVNAEEPTTPKPTTEHSFFDDVGEKFVSNFMYRKVWGQKYHSESVKIINRQTP